MWYLVYSIINATNTFHCKGKKIGDIRPQNIFINELGEVKVASILTWPNQQSNYQKTVFDKQITYLAPEQLKDMNYCKFQQNSNYQISQSFSVGLACLDAATLSKSIQLYLPNIRFDYNQLQNRINQLENQHIYSQPLFLLIKGLCQGDTQKRITVNQLSLWLAKHQKDIIQLVEFRVDQLPDKLKFIKYNQTNSIRNSHPFRQNSNLHPPPQNNIVYKNPVNQPIQHHPNNQYPIQQGYIHPLQRNNNNFLMNKPSYQSQSIQPNYIENYPTQYNANKPIIIRESTPINQKDVVQSIVIPVRGNFNLKQIDQQFQINRKIPPNSSLY